jgi:hypothetical protein
MAAHRQDQKKISRPKSGAAHPRNALVANVIIWKLNYQRGNGSLLNPGDLSGLSQNKSYAASRAQVFFILTILWEANPAFFMNFRRFRVTFAGQNFLFGKACQFVKVLK